MLNHGAFSVRTDMGREYYKLLTWALYKTVLNNNEDERITGLYIF